MKKIMIFSNNDLVQMQEDIDMWIIDENPEIISSSITGNEDYAHISIVYDDRKGNNINI